MSNLSSSAGCADQIRAQGDRSRPKFGRPPLPIFPTLSPEVTAIESWPARHAHFEAHAGRGKKRRAHSPGTGSVPQQQEGERQDVVRALVDFELMHSFVAVLSGGLNLAKQIVRVHFSIDRQAYAHLPATAATWEEGVMGWYHEFHRLDVHGRSRYSMLLERVLRGMLGDGYTGGLLTEALDMLRVKAEVREETMLEAETSPERRLARSRGEATRTLNVDPLSGVILRPAKTFQEGFVSCDSSPASPAAAAGDEHAVAPTLMVPAGAAAAALESRGKAPGGKPGRGAMDVMGSIQVWVDLCGSDSILSHRLHFDSFAQWCHSAHLLPFIQRCYRRCGIAGLAPDQSIGRYRHGMSPHDPLVLPTMVDFCYGHCYPFHRILQYFYGGMSRIMCSIDDPREAESDRAALGLIAGQDSRSQVGELIVESAFVVAWASMHVCVVCQDPNHHHFGSNHFGCESLVALRSRISSLSHDGNASKAYARGDRRALCSTSLQNKLCAVEARHCQHASSAEAALFD